MRSQVLPVALLLGLPGLVAATTWRRSEITDCLSRANVTQVLPGSTNFTAAIKPFNLRLPFTPVAVAVPSTVHEIQSAVSCAAALGITVSPKSGGHSYASHDLGGEDGHLMIDLKLFNSVHLDTPTGIAEVGPGARLGNVAKALYDQGKRAISHGTCPGVGVGGHVLHGGYGYISHTHGLALDNLIAAEVVLANSSVVTASTTVNPDLFWVLRGAGSSYGVVTSLKFQTFPAPEDNINFANSSMPTEMNVRIIINAFSTSLLGVYYGKREDYEKAIDPVLAQLGTPASTSVATKGWIDTLLNYAYAPSLETPLDYDYFAKSLMSPYLTASALKALCSYWFTTAKRINRNWYLILDLHGGPNSAISKVLSDSTSYAHRGAIFKAQFYDSVFGGTYPKDGFSFLNGWVSAVTSTMNTTDFGMYINYADTSLSTTEAEHVYWLAHYNRLAEIKRVLDPRDIFSNPQAVRPI
ncbi:glucooligosaccharide oxidase [Diaporthe sp. PMI_573]|nr:glucooligosaccharide oxidase [Diaporthaceae sp. PMI_573]